MNLMSRRELTDVVRDRYWRASKTDKSKILGEFVENTGYHRKYALALLHKGRPSAPPQVGGVSVSTRRMSLMP